MFILPFMNPAQAKRQMELRCANALRHAIPYSNFKIPRRCIDIGVDASTFHPENPLESFFPDVEPDKPVLSPSGRLAYRKTRLPKGEGLPIVGASDLYHDDGRVFFTDDVIIPALLYSQPHRQTEWQTWMGLSPFEMASQQSGIRAATKNVVLGGLGMGWLLSQIVAKKTVKSVIVIEKDEELLEWFGYDLCKGMPKVKDVICGDVWEEVPKLSRDCRFILDIWEGHGDAQWDHRLERFRETGVKCWAWGSPRGSQW